MSALTTEQKLELALAGLAAAQSVIEYCGGGDAWERECNMPSMLFAEDACTRLDVGDYDLTPDGIAALRQRFDLPKRR